MTLALNLLPALAAAFILTFARIGALLMLVPGYGEQFFPARMRLTLALAITLIMLPLVQPLLASVPPNVESLVALVVHEVLVGLFIGLVLRFITMAMSTAGSVIAQQTGLSFISQLDPTQGTQSALLANFMTLLATAFVFATDLHHLALAAIHDSYTVFAPTLTFPSDDFAKAGLTVFVGSFKLAIQLSAPFIVAGLVFQVALGVLSRLQPQLQILFLLLPVQIVAGFLLLLALLSTMLGWYSSHLQETYGHFLNN